MNMTDVSGIVALSTPAVRPPDVPEAARRGASGTSAAASQAAGESFEAATATVQQEVGSLPKPAPAPKVEKAHREFEAFVLQSFIEAMLPDGADDVFGKGIAGETWKSMMAEKLAREVARSGQVGIAERIAGASTTHSALEINSLAPNTLQPR